MTYRLHLLCAWWQCDGWFLQLSCQTAHNWTDALSRQKRELLSILWDYYVQRTLCHKRNIWMAFHWYGLPCDVWIVRANESCFIHYTRTLSFEYSRTKESCRKERTETVHHQNGFAYVSLLIQTQWTTCHWYYMEMTYQSSWVANV